VVGEEEVAVESERDPVQAAVEPSNSLDNRSYSWYNIYDKRKKGSLKKLPFLIE